MTSLRSSELETIGGHASQPDTLPRGADLADLSRRLTEALEPLAREVTSRRGVGGWLGAGPAWPVRADSPSIAVALCTLEGRFIEVNDTLERVTGYARDEFVGRTGSDVGLWGDVEGLLHCLRSKGAVDGYKLPYRTRAGQTRFLLLAARLLTVNGRGGILAVGVDLAARAGFDYETTL